VARVPGGGPVTPASHKPQTLNLPPKPRKHGLSAEQFPVSAYIECLKNLKDLNPEAWPPSSRVTSPTRPPRTECNAQEPETLHAEPVPLAGWQGRNTFEVARVPRYKTLPLLPKYIF